MSSADLSAPGTFIVATGIECSAPLIAGGIRQDELRKTGHGERYDEDFGLTRALGLRWLRCGVPFHLVAHRDRLDWSWVDRAMASLVRHRLIPIVDLMHFGIPADLYGVSDGRLVERFIRYVEGFLERYPWVRVFAPVNEPWITALMSTRHGMWNERLRDERALVRALDVLCTCVVEGMRRIRPARSDATFIQSDPCERWIAKSADTREEAALLNEQRFVAWELCYGRRPSRPAVRWLRDNGFATERLRWFERHGSTEGCIVGHDYYVTNEREIFAPDRSNVLEPLAGYRSVALEYHERLGLPFMLAETNREAAFSAAWLQSTWNDSVTLREEGLPIRGYCWYSLTDQVDWDTALTEDRGHVDTLGLVDLDRRMRPVRGLFRSIAIAASEGRFERLPATNAPDPSLAA